MDRVMMILEIVLPIFAAIFLGIWARKKGKISEEENQGFQKFVMKFGLPCILFNSCLTGNIGIESLATMLTVLPLLLISALWAFQARKKDFPYHNFPFLFTAQESGMLGIPLYMTLFGVDQAYRMGVLDMAQTLICVPVIALLTADAGKNPGIKELVKNVFRSPLLLMSLLGLTLNLTGLIEGLNRIGAGSVLTGVTGFIAQPVSAVILFSVGYNFSIGKDNLKLILKLCGIHIGLFALFCVIIQGVMFLLPESEVQTRWAVLLYCALPSSFLTPGFGRTKEENRIASGVCSLLTIVCLVVFCIMAVCVPTG